MMKNTNRPLVSVIMPVYNAEAYLAEALDSLLRQTYENFELIIINDGSKDNSQAIIDTYVARDDRIIALHQTNKGVVAAANRAASKARGKYIIRTDSDDISFNTRLEDLVACALSHPEAVVISGNIEVINERGEFVYRHIIPPYTEEIKRAMYLRNPLPNGATLIRRDAFEEVGRYSDVFAEDFHLWVKLFDKGDFVATDSFVYRWRINSTGLTMSNNDKSIAKEKEYAAILWGNYTINYLPRKAVLERANAYYQTFERHGIEYKHIFLFDLARTSIHLMKRGKLAQGTKQLFTIASTGRTGLKIVWQRLWLATHGASQQVLKKVRRQPQGDNTTSRPVA